MVSIRSDLARPWMKSGKHRTPGGKHQTPNTKPQRNSKHQAPNRHPVSHANSRPLQSGCLAMPLGIPSPRNSAVSPSLAVWGLGLPRSLRFEVWSLKFFWSLVFGVWCFPSHASEYDPLFARWYAAQTNLQSWSADFTQTRSLKVLAQPLVSSGKVWVAPGEFRWELGQPPQTIALRQPDQLLIIYPRLKRAEKYPLTGVPPGPLKDALALLDASLPRDRASMEERFRLLSSTLTNSVLQMTLQPKSASARKFINEIVIGFRTNDFSIALTEMTFADGSAMRNDFANVVLNQPLDPALFEPKLSPDITVTEPLGASR
jgi:outer membrane lipoprotein-sorting protein